ncbi:hypothetical protein HZ326_7089 [Fusarium oxysporum f. sp. albedinis]|nr:hypothetical protein HZ326_7089 [Fusarium oxysporum f. sp. albedinis]
MCRVTGASQNELERALFRSKLMFRYVCPILVLMPHCFYGIRVERTGCLDRGFNLPLRTIKIKLTHMRIESARCRQFVVVKQSMSSSYSETSVFKEVGRGRGTQVHNARDTRQACAGAKLYLVPVVKSLLTFSLLSSLHFLRTIKSTGLDVFTLGVGHIQCKRDRVIFCCHTASRDTFQLSLRPGRSSDTSIIYLFIHLSTELLPPHSKCIISNETGIGPSCICRLHDVCLRLSSAGMVHSRSTYLKPALRLATRYALLTSLDNPSLRAASVTWFAQRKPIDEARELDIGLDRVQLCLRNDISLRTSPSLGLTSSCSSLGSTRLCLDGGS